MRLTPIESASHWYHRDGRPCHQVPMKKDPSKMRFTDVRDARKLSLVPSVTNIIAVVASENLVAWRIDQAILACLTLQRKEGESEEEYLNRIIIDMDRERDDAAKLGSTIHSIIETYLLTGDKPTPEQGDEPVIFRAAELVEPFYTWANANITNVHYCEQVVVGEGYAGTVDLKAEVKDHGLCILDFKSRKPAADGGFALYSKDRRQLAAYRAADAIHRPPADKCISVLVNSKDITEPFIHVWDHAKIESGYASFLACLEVWKDEKNYDPRNP